MNHKIILIFLFVISISNGLFAQIGIKAGFNFSNTNFEQKTFTDKLLDSHVGATFDIPLSKRIAFQTALMWSSKCFGSYITYYSGYETTRINYVEIPFMLALSHPIPKGCMIYAAFGSYLSLAASGRYKSDYQVQNGNHDIVDRHLVFGNNAFADYKAFDAGGVVHIGVQANHIRANIGYDIGLVNISNRGEIRKNKCLYVSMAYIFKKK